MRILLIQPPIQDFYETDIRLQPIGLCYLKSAVKAHHPAVEIAVRDYHSGLGRRTVPLPNPLRFLRDYYPVRDQSPFSTFHDFFHFGKDFDEIVNEVLDFRPDLIGISALFTPYHREAVELARRIKKRTDAPIVLGGHHVSAAPRQVLAQPCVDYVITGEGERPLVELIDHLLGNRPLARVTNCGYKDQSGKQHFTATGDNFDIATLAPPDLGDLPLERYTLQGKPLCFMITSRSCPHRCSFCSVHTTFGTRFRRRPIEDVFAEIELRYLQGYRVIDFEDDNLTFYKKEFKELCRRISARFPNQELELVAMNGISYISLDDEMLELMRTAGFRQLNLALVTSDKTVRETTKRPHTIEAYLRVVDKAHALGMQMVSYQILGLPGESLQSMIQTMAFNARLPVLLGASPFYMTPGSPIAGGVDMSDDDLLLSRTAVMGQGKSEAERNEIYTLFICARIINFLKGLDLAGTACLDSLLTSTPRTKRDQIGFTLLAELAQTGQLEFWTSKGRTPNSRFDAQILAAVLEIAHSIRCLNGQTIAVTDYAQRLAGFGRAVAPAVEVIAAQSNA